MRVRQKIQVDLVGRRPNVLKAAATGLLRISLLEDERGRGVTHCVRRILQSVNDSAIPSGTIGQLASR